MRTLEEDVLTFTKQLQSKRKPQNRTAQHKHHKLTTTEVDTLLCLKRKASGAKDLRKMWFATCVVLLIICLLESIQTTNSKPSTPSSNPPAATGMI